MYQDHWKVKEEQKFKVCHYYCTSEIHLNIMNKLGELHYESYVRNSPKHEPIGSYFYLSRQLTKCRTRADTFNLYVDPVRAEIISTQHIPILQLFYLDKRESKVIIVYERYHHRQKLIASLFYGRKINHKVLSSMQGLQMRANQKTFTKVSTQTK